MATADQIGEHYDSLAFVYHTYWGDPIHHGLFETGNESAEDAQVKMLDHCVPRVNLRGGETIRVGSAFVLHLAIYTDLFGKELCDGLSGSQLCSQQPGTIS